MDTSKYNYLISLYQFLKGQESLNRDKLRKAPGHFMHVGNIEKIKNDISLLEPIIKAEQARLNAEVESLTNGKFQFITTENGSAEREPVLEASK